MSELKPLRDLKSLRDYNNWIGHTAYDVQHAVIGLGGWGNVFPGPLPRWASRIRQYFNLNPTTLRLLDENESGRHLAMAQTAVDSIRDSISFQKKLRGLNLQKPLVNLKPDAPIDTFKGQMGTLYALSDDVYEDEIGRMIWFQMSAGAGIYHFGEKPQSPTLRALGAAHRGQKYSPIFKLVSPDGTGGSRECCVKNIFDVVKKTKTRIDGEFTSMLGYTTIGAVNETVNVAEPNRIVKDSVAQGSYNYAETMVKGLPEHERLDVETDPMEPGYYVEPPNLFQFSDVGLLSNLHMRRFPEKDGRKNLADQKEPAP